MGSWGTETEIVMDYRGVDRFLNRGGGGALCVEIGFYADIS